ncbi:MAG: ATP-binding cassette domain-containing protein [Clostridiales bacterium]|nr:ATP-binding cassette domain-containing protein [Clostridiales bacterium]
MGEVLRPQIKIAGLKKYFKVNGGLLHAVDGIDLEIGEGRTLGVVGESGCGKSTLGRLVLRLLEPTAGQVLLNGENIFDYDKKQMRRVRQQMQIIFQDPFSSLNPRLPVFDLIAEPLVMNRVCRNREELTEKIRGLMEMVGLAERYINAYPHEMDGGRRQRVGIARALALNPGFIVCDEPVSALDVSIQAQILNLLMDLQQELNLMYMFITHDLSVVKHISDEIAVMYLGQCVEHCPSDELFENPLHPYTKSLLSAIPAPKLTPVGEGAALIRGEVSDPIDPKPGCRFAPRCDLCTGDCEGADIPLLERTPGHFAACVRQ